MRPIKENDFTTYPRKFDTYRWYKPILVGLLFFIFAAILNLGLLEPITKALFGMSVSSTGYDDMDFFTAAGAFYNGVSAASFIPCILLAALIVRDRPISSYFSSMGGWRWRVFLKTLAAAFVFMGIPTVILHIVHGRTADIRFTIGGFILLTLLAPLQGIAEELTCRSYIMQTVSSWFLLPAAGIIAQVVYFIITHPYNIVGKVEIAVSGILYALIVYFTKGIESSSALHIMNNMSEIYLVGIGFGSITAEQTVPDITVNLLCKIVFFIFILYADRKLHWFDKAKQ